MSRMADMGAVRQTSPVWIRVAGKPLVWSRSWTVVVVVWVLAGGLLLAARLQMGHLTAWTPREAAAVGAVRAHTPDGMHRCDELLGALARHLAWRAGRHEVPVWYAFDRPWERRVYVTWEWGDEVALSFVVERGKVVSDRRTRAILDALTETWSLR